jgi:hypothetical protein
MKGVGFVNEQHQSAAVVRQGFEVEDLTTCRNWMWVYEPDKRQVDMYETSPSVGCRLHRTYREQAGRLVCITDEGAVANPFGCCTAHEYYQALYRKSVELPGAFVVSFLRWVDADNLNMMIQ